MTTYERTPLTPEILELYGIRGIHPYLERIPEANDEVFQSVCSDVEANGFAESIVINDDDILLDGRLRLQVGCAISLDPPMIRLNPSDVLRFVIGQNVSRHHMTPEEQKEAKKQLKEFRAQPSAPAQPIPF